jgi:nucleoside-diphosphate-sugar epimerase
LVVLNPALVMGPALTAHSQSGSIAAFKQLVDGSARPGVPRVAVPLVDVRDVARAHLLAAATPTAHGRYLLVANTTSLLEMAEALRPTYPQLPLPPREMPKWLTWLIAPFVGLRRSFVARNVGYPLKFDNTRSREELGVVYRPLQETLLDQLAQLIRDGVIAAEARDSAGLRLLARTSQRKRNPLSE